MSNDLSRRRFLQLVAGTGVASHALAGMDSQAASAVATTLGASIGDDALRLEFDSHMRSRAWHVQGSGKPSIALTAWAETEYLLLADGSRVEHFQLRHQEREPVRDQHGNGTRLTLTGVSPQIEKTVRIELHERYPGFAFYRVSYRNLSAQPIALAGWRTCDVQLVERAAEGAEPKFWSYCGSTHEDRRDWVQPVKAGFSQENYMGMTASDYGGGTPIVDVWRRDCGIAVGHLERDAAAPVAARQPYRARREACDRGCAQAYLARTRGIVRYARDLRRDPHGRLFPDAGCLSPHHGRTRPRVTARAASRLRAHLVCMGL